MSDETQPVSAASPEPVDTAMLRRVCSACGHAPHGGKCGAELPEDTYLGSHCKCVETSTEACSFCGVAYPMPVSLHHTQAECDAQQLKAYHTVKP